MMDILGHIREIRKSPLDIFEFSLRETTPDAAKYRGGLFRDRSKFTSLLDQLRTHPEGRKVLDDWLRTSGLDIIKQFIEKEIDHVKEAFTMKVDEVTPQFLDEWDFDETLVSTTKTKAPILFDLLRNTCQSDMALEKNKIKKADDVSVISCVPACLTSPVVLLCRHRSARQSAVQS
jgi:hypothetical protein